MVISTLGMPKTFIFGQSEKFRHNTIFQFFVSLLFGSVHAEITVFRLADKNFHTVGE